MEKKFEEIVFTSLLVTKMCVLNIIITIRMCIYVYIFCDQRLVKCCFQVKITVYRFFTLPDILISDTVINPSILIHS